MRALILTTFLALTGAAAAQPASLPAVGALVVGTSGGRVDGSGHEADEARTPGSFAAVRVNGPINVQLKASTREHVSVHFDDNLLPMIETRIVADTPPALEIRLLPGASFKSSHTPKVTVEFKAINALAMRGSGDVRADALQGTVLAVSIAGTGDLRVDRMDVDVLGVSIAGSGDFAAVGRANEQGYSIAGNGDVNASDLVGQTVKVRIAGSGDARVHAEQMLVVSIAGSGDVVYRGNPTIKKSIAGSGEVRKAH